MDSYKICMVKEIGISYPDIQIKEPRDCVMAMAQIMGDFDREHAVILALDVRHNIIGMHTVSIGSLDSCIVHPREVFKFAILANASGIIFIHNHPSGNAESSVEDTKLYQRLKEVGDLMGIDVWDGIIIGRDGNYFSSRRGYVCNGKNEITHI